MQKPENTCYQWLINLITVYMIQSESKTKQTFMTLFESEIDINTHTDYISKKISDASEGRYVKYKSEKDKNHQWKNTLKKLGYTYVIW